MVLAGVEMPGRLDCLHRGASWMVPASKCSSQNRQQGPGPVPALGGTRIPGDGPTRESL